MALNLRYVYMYTCIYVFMNTTRRTKKLHKRKDVCETHRVDGVGFMYACMYVRICVH